MKKLIGIILVASGLFSTIAHAATDSEIVAELASTCWRLPEDTNYNRASATFEVSYNAEGELTQIVTVEYQPVRKAGELFAISAQDAIVNCASKTSVLSRTIRVVMRYAEQKTDGPLIMKRPLR